MTPATIELTDSQASLLERVKGAGEFRIPASDERQCRGDFKELEELRRIGLLVGFFGRPCPWAGMAPCHWELSGDGWHALATYNSATQEMGK